MRIVCGHLDLFTCVDAVASAPNDQTTQAAQTVVADGVCDGAVCSEDVIEVSFLAVDATAESVAATFPLTYGRLSSQPATAKLTRTSDASDAYRGLLAAVLTPGFSQPDPVAPSPPVVCGRVVAIDCAQAVEQALKAHLVDNPVGVAAEYGCPPGAWCSFYSSYFVALLVGTPSTFTPWPPIYLVSPAQTGLPATTQPWHAPVQDYVATVIRAAGWGTSL